MRVLVCGGRDFDDLPLLGDALERVHARHVITLLTTAARRALTPQHTTGPDLSGCRCRSFTPIGGSLAAGLVRSAIVRCWPKAGRKWCWRFRADAALRIWSSRRVQRASAFAR